MRGLYRDNRIEAVSGAPVNRLTTHTTKYDSTPSLRAFTFYSILGSDGNEPDTYLSVVTMGMSGARMAVQARPSSAATTGFYVRVDTDVANQTVGGANPPGSRGAGLHTIAVRVNEGCTEIAVWINGVLTGTRAISPGSGISRQLQMYPPNYDTYGLETMVFDAYHSEAQMREVERRLRQAYSGRLEAQAGAPLADWVSGGSSVPVSGLTGTEPLTLYGIGVRQDAVPSPGGLWAGAGTRLHLQESGPTPRQLVGGRNTPAVYARLDSAIMPGPFVACTTWRPGVQVGLHALDVGSTTIPDDTTIQTAGTRLEGANGWRRMLLYKGEHDEATRARVMNWLRYRHTDGPYLLTPLSMWQFGPAAPAVYSNRIEWASDHPDGWAEGQWHELGGRSRNVSLYLYGRGGAVPGDATQQARLRCRVESLRTDGTVHIARYGLTFPPDTTGVHKLTLFQLPAGTVRWRFCVEPLVGWISKPLSLYGLWASHS